MRTAFAHRPHPGFVLRTLTIVLTVAMLALGVLAAHHEANVSANASHTVIQDPHGISASSNDPEAVAAGVNVFATLAAGCVLLALCCVFALALLNRFQWLAALARYLGAIAADQQRPPLLPLARFLRLPEPSLTALSISRT